MESGGGRVCCFALLCALQLSTNSLKIFLSRIFLSSANVVCLFVCLLELLRVAKNSAFVTFSKITISSLEWH